ncbi:MAG TPA: hypothetical protein EYP85_14700 [Armatimonadetes bacterium]|nr:hypothetical protein [Armatimonadota bacterium]
MKLQGSLWGLLAVGTTVAGKSSFWSTGQRVHDWIWTRFVHPQTNLLQTRLAGGDPLEDGSLYGGFYLACLVDAYAVTGEERLREEAQRIFSGLWRNATVSGRPGFLARGVAPDGTYRGDPSVDQYTGLLYGCWRYFHSPLSGPPEQERIRRLFAEVLTRLEANDWRITRENGEVTTFGHLEALRPTRAERLLAFLRAGYEVTGQAHWLEVYHQLLPPRLSHCRDYTGTVSWVGLQSQVCLRMLMALETAPQVRETYLAGTRHLAEVCRPPMAAFRQVPPPTAGEEALAPFYREGRLFTETIRIPLEAVTVLLLTEGEPFPSVALQVLEEMNERLEVERITLSTAAVPWEWNQWLALGKGKGEGEVD